jgi:transcriptional regulator with XRE-family HTH domain
MDSQDFARAFGRALAAFLTERGLKQTDAVKKLGLDLPTGRARLSTYCRGKRDGSWVPPDAMMLYLLCTKLGFRFKYNGYTISAAVLGRKRARPVSPIEQLQIEFDGKFNLSDQQGTVQISVKRPPGRIGVALSLKGGTAN